MKALIARVLAQPCFVDAPPVFVDVGASGALPRLWAPLAEWSVCVAFDADSRDFAVARSEAAGWKSLYTVNRIVAPGEPAERDFYLTRSPHCSSTLPPDAAALAPWAFSPLFEVARTVKLGTVDLGAALRQLGLPRIDWLKCDSQGTDLRIFRSLEREMADRMLAADFEPGIIDAYRGEDKLHHVLAYMETRPFWVSEMRVRGSQRIDEAELGRLGTLERRNPASFLKTSPGWCEISYLNDCTSEALTERDCLLAWLFATLKAQHGFAAGLARRSAARFGGRLFEELLAFSRGRLRRGPMHLAADAWRRLFPGEH
jgi:hypothetical protein